jgi:hypothetical protein
MQAAMHHSIFPSQKQCLFFALQNCFFIQEKEKLPNFVCLFKILPFTDEADSKMKQKKDLTLFKHLFWQKQTVEVADT